MKTLSSTLLAAQKSPATLPTFKLVGAEYLGSVKRLTFSRLYTGAEADDKHAAAMPGDGSLIRARIATQTLYRSRVTSPGPGSDFSLWTSWRTATRNVALAALGADARVVVVDDTTPTTIYTATSNDNGGTWGSFSNIETAASAVTALAIAYKSATELLLAYVEGTTLHVKKWTQAGGWGATSAWAETVNALTGVALVYSGDWNLILTGKENTTLNPKLWQLIYGDGGAVTANTFGTLAEVQGASDGSNIVFQAPFIAKPDVYRTYFVEKYSGAGAYKRPLWSHTPATAGFVDALWREPVPFAEALARENGLAIAHSTTEVWLTEPGGVWRAVIPATAGVDHSTRVLKADIRRSLRGGSCQVELRTDDGGLQPIPAELDRGARLSLTPGYRTSSGDEFGQEHTFWVEATSHHVGPKTSVLVIEGLDGWGLLQRWRAPRQISFAAGSKSISDLVKWVCARAGLDFASLSASSQFTALQPAFTILPGEDGRQVVQRLLAKVRDELFFREGDPKGKFPQASDATDYSYGGSGNQEILAGRYGNRALEANHALVTGDGAYGEDLAYSEIARVYHRPVPVRDFGLTTEAQADDRAVATLRDATILGTGASIEIAPNVGQELLDVVSLTDSRAGVADDTRRVIALQLSYHPARARYSLSLDLGGV